MNIQDLVAEFDPTYDEPIWADITEVLFAASHLSIKFVVSRDNVLRAMIITCSEVTAYRISDHYFEWLYLESNSPEMMAYSSNATTYVMWGDDVDWPKLLGRLTQEFGYIPGMLKHKYVRETVSRQDYRLPIRVPLALDEKFRELMDGLNVQVYVHERREGIEGLQVLRFGNDSYIIAKGFELTEGAT